MSFRRRTVLLAAGAVAASVALASVAVYFVTRNELRGQVDASLRDTLTPGQPQSVQIHAIDVTSKQLAKLEREGRWPPRLPSGLALFESASVTTHAPAASSFGSAQASGRTLEARPAGEAGEAAPKATGAVRIAPDETITIERKRCVSNARCSTSRTTVGKPTAVRAVAGAAPKSSGQGYGYASPTAKLVLPKQAPGGSVGYVQLLLSDGELLQTESAGHIPVTAATHAVAAGRRKSFFSTVTIGGTRERLLTERAPGGGVWQAVLPLSQVDSTLTHLKLVLAIVCLAGIALAAALGLLVARGALAPVRRLTGAVERIGRTQDLGHRIRADGGDELGRLADSFNAMLAALERSRLAQRQLVSDASHELRTPLTSVQANLDVLALGGELSPAERARVIASAQAQLRELTVMIGDLVDLSKTEVEDVEVEDVRLDLAVAGAVERARLHTPGARFALALEPCLVRIAPQRLDRAVANLLDNALKWSPAGAAVEVCVRGGALRVRDHGPGIAEQDLHRIFDRFYRAPAARGRPGSGLGLAIVRQAAELHGGSVHAANARDGGAVLTFELPALVMTAAESGAGDPGTGPGASENGDGGVLGAGAGAAPVHKAPRSL